MSEPKQKLSGLDHLRALAIILVFLYHYGRLFGHPEWVGDICKFGWTGVDLFFVLSGFLIASQLLQQYDKSNTIFAGEFYVKRFFRIIPAYLTVVAIYFLVPAFREFEGLSPLWKYLTYTQNFGLDLKLYHCFSHAWSLCIEEQFYLFLPLMLLLGITFRVNKAGWFLLGFLFVLGFALRMHSWQSYLAEQPLSGPIWFKYVYYPTYNRLDGLLAGITIASLWQYRPKFKMAISKNGNLCLLIGLALSVAAYVLCLDQTSYKASIYGFPLVALAFSFFLTGAISPTSVFYKYGSSITSYIATLSYAIYLSHKGIIHVVQEALSSAGIDKDSNSMFVACIIGCGMAAMLLHYIVERPFMKLRGNILQKRRHKKAASPVSATTVVTTKKGFGKVKE